MKRFMHRSTVTRAERAKLAEELTELGMALGITERACCCPARPVVRVMMPATARRPDPADLLLCGHHYRASQAALQAACPRRLRPRGHADHGNCRQAPTSPPPNRRCGVATANPQE